jgi:hypothetical protein
VTIVGQLVDLSGSRWRKYVARDNAVAFEFAQTLDEERAAHARQPIKEIDEPPWAELELADDEQRPAIADHIERSGGSAVLLIKVLRHAEGEVYFLNLRI